MFEKKSNIIIEADKVDEEKLMNLALEAGADDIQQQGEVWQVLSDPAAHEGVVEALAAAKIETLSAEVGMVPKNTIKLEGSAAKGMMKLNDALEDYDDVQNVYSNYEIDEADLE
jgi:transcriptional/translational regulatory protein YebC/TACO1